MVLLSPSAFRVFRSNAPKGEKIEEAKAHAYKTMTTQSDI
jgi:hypothetical protein